MTEKPGGPAEQGTAPDGGGPVEHAWLRDPAVFAGEIRAALRYEAGLMLKAAVVLAVVAVILVLRAMY
jgi:hypothetical protein